MIAIKGQGELKKPTQRTRNIRRDENIFDRK